MSRRLGPQWKISRSLQFPLLGGKEFSKGKKRTSLPGIHGISNSKKKYSSYSAQNQAKQRIRFLYGTREKQLYNTFFKLKKIKKENIGQSLIIIHESRLDNLIYRAGILPTRNCVRQMVSYGHFLVNGNKVKSPSCQIKPGQIISFRKEKITQNKLIQDTLALNLSTPLYISLNKKDMSITYLRQPNSEDKEIKDIIKNINPFLTVEWYNKKI